MLARGNDAQSVYFGLRSYGVLVRARGKNFGDCCGLSKVVIAIGKMANEISQCYDTEALELPTRSRRYMGHACNRGRKQRCCSVYRLAWARLRCHADVYITAGPRRTLQGPLSPPWQRLPKERECMKRLSVALLVVVVLTATAACAKMSLQPLSSPTPFVAKNIWIGISGGYEIRWTTGEISAHPVAQPATVTFSEIGLTIADFHALTRAQSADCDLTRTAQLQSVVGPILSIQNSDTMKCTNGATGKGLSSVAIDLTRPKAHALLSDYFPPHELGALNIKAEHFCKAVPKDLLGRFAFRELHAKTVVVAVTLPPNCTQSEVDLALNAPASLMSALAQAAQRKAGFLWRDQPAISGGQATDIKYHYLYNAQ